MTNLIIPKIVILGNGFDLNQGLNTSYCDFVNSSEFNDLVSSNNYLASYLKSQNDVQNWIDIENELKLYSKNESVKNGNDFFQKDFNSLSNSLIKYLKTINYDKLKKESLSYKLLEEIFKDDFLILDFNYTDTVSNILIELGLSEDEINSKHIKVHGSIKENQIIFGVEDRANIKSEHVFLRKAFNKHFKAINVSFQLKNLTDLYIFGHSLGETDHMYFNDFFSLVTNPYDMGIGKNITMYYYGDNGYTQIFKQLDVLTNNNLTLFKQINNFKIVDTLASN